MPRYPHIPGIPLMGPGGLRGLTRASEFVTMPRAPVHFLKNVGPRPVVPSAIPRPPAPFARARPLVAPGAPRRLAFRDAPVDPVSFPRLVPAAPPTPPPSPLRFTYWETPSLSKEGVRRAYINRRLPSFSPSPSSIPVPKRFLQGAPRKHAAFSVSAFAPSLEDALREPAPPTPCKPKSVRIAVSAPTPRSGMCSRRSASSLRSILVQSRPADEVRVKKSVRFGDVAVHDVDYWIDRKSNDDRGLWKMGRMQGWRVIPLSEPDEDGLWNRYMSMWGNSDHHSSLYYHIGMPKCTNPGCHWEEIAQVYRAFLRKGVSLWDRHDLILYAWSELRERERQKGRWLL
ncbi:uncharacterized protein TRUGW13939_01572 [Talaromyces rugulosus]|uniref:Uncharacterized protein n=1 Tax=Talaromyces rugulosus TaxID=121627 RepID=A0A7H8QLR7_TALRU|nr:uncharacterized protein TRUGW13939_01572 [Talaromyces rugulosus]QKX54485.1 hypothetical protein TRUGW13939_01572 [Talaromyces rugulosus]